MSDTPRYVVVPNMGCYRDGQQISPWQMAADIANMLDKLTRRAEAPAPSRKPLRIARLVTETGETLASLQGWAHPSPRARVHLQDGRVVPIGRSRARWVRRALLARLCRKEESRG